VVVVVVILFSEEIMPYKSDAQRRYFNANRAQLERNGVNVDEWNDSSRGKKLPKKVQTKEAATSIDLLCDELMSKLAAELPANQMVNMDSTSGMLADVLPAFWGGERAGRTQAMADAMGEKTTFGVRHPVTSVFPAALAGGATGALTGAVAGGLAGSALGSRGAAPALAMMGGGLGGTAGSLLGVAMMTALRRKEMQRINDLYDERMAEGGVNPKDPEFSMLSALLLPGRGPHRVGQLEAVRAMRNEAPIRNGIDVRDLGYGATLASRAVAGPVVSVPLSIAHGYGQNIYTQVANGGKTASAVMLRATIAHDYGTME
jgi:hypothetical protein